MIKLPIPLLFVLVLGYIAGSFFTREPKEVELIAATLVSFSFVLVLSAWSTDW